MITTVIGLGNIGKKYEGTRHNLGFDLLNDLAEKWGVKAQTGVGDYYLAEKELQNGAVRLVWPTTYMNNSGRAVAQIMERFQLSPGDLLVAYDDFNLLLGRLRIRTGGSDGGHNGMASIIYQLGTEEILRLRMGIGPIPPETDPVVYVLNRFRDEELESRNKMLVKSREAVLYLLRFGAEKAMSMFNPAPEDTQTSGAV